MNQSKKTGGGWVNISGFSGQFNITSLFSIGYALLYYESQRFVFNLSCSHLGHREDEAEKQKSSTLRHGLLGMP